MNKNIIKLFAILMMCFLIGSVLVACGSTNEDNEEVFTVDIVDGYWVINGVKTDVKAEGKDGANGLPGKDGADADSIRCEEHHWDPVYVTIAEHTQDTIGLFLKVCVDCDGAEVIRYDHVYDQKGETVAPTCTDAGYTVYSCICGKVDPATTERDVVAALGHVKGEKEYVEFDGTKYCACQWNNPWVKWCVNECCTLETPLEEGNDGIQPHEYTEWAPAEQGSIPDCDWIVGTMHRVCIKCEASAVCDCEDSEQTDTKGGVAPGHAEGQAYTKVDIVGEEIVASFICKDCGDKVTDKFAVAAYTTTTPATCAQDGSIVVSFQGKELSKTILHKEDVEHTWVVTPAQDKTCTQNGTTESKKCSVCNAEEKATVDFALGHNNGLKGDADTGRDHSVVTVNGVEYDAYWCAVCKHWVAYQKHEG